MNLKIIGALCIIFACGGTGYSMAAAHRYEERTLHQLISALNHMGCELQYRLTPLPELCKRVAVDAQGIVGQVLLDVSKELEMQLVPDAVSCMQAVLSRSKKLPRSVYKNLKELGITLGRFDLEGQLKGIEAVRTQCRTDLEALENNRDARLRSYQTLGLCAGCALAILFL